MADSKLENGGDGPQEIKIEGCELCSDWPVVLSSRCHPTAPLRLEMIDEETLVAYCYLPQCNREVARFKIAKVEA